MSQDDAALRAGVSQPTWCAYEGDKKLPRADVIESLIALTATEPDLALTFEMFAQAERDRRPENKVPLQSPDETGPRPAPVPYAPTGKVDRHAHPTRK